MAVNIGPKIGIDGEAQYRKELNSIIQQAKTLASEMKAVTSAFDKNDNSQAKLTAQTRVLTQQIEVQQRRVEQLQKGLDAAAKKYGETDSRTLKWKQAVNDATAELNRMQVELKQTTSETDDLGDELESAGRQVSSLGDIIKGSFLGNLMADAVSNIVSELGNLVGEGTKAADALTKFRSTMDFAGYDAGTIEETADAMQDYASRTVYDLQTVANTTAQLAANSVPDFEALTEAAGNLNAVAGGNADTFQSVAMVLTQTAGAGKLTTENWNQLTDAIPGASGVLQKAMLDAGAYTGNFREAMEQGQISAEEFNAAILELGQSDAAREAATSVDTVEGSIGNLKATIEGIITSLLNSGGSDIITSTVNGISGAIQAAGDFVTNHGDEITGFLTNAKTTLQEIGTQISPYIQSFFDYIGGRVQSEIELWNQLSSRFEEYKTKLQTAWSEIQPYVQPIIEFYDNLNSAEMDAIKNVVQFFSDLSKAGWESMEDIAQWYQSVVQWSTETSVGIVNGFNDAVNFFKNLPSSAYQWASDMISKFANGISDGIGQVRSAVSSVAGLVTSWLHFSRPDVGPLREYESWMPDMMAGMARGIRQNAWQLEDALDAATSYLQPNINVSGSGRSPGTVNLGGVQITVQAAPGMDVDQLARAVAYRIQLLTNQKGAAF